MFDSIAFVDLEVNPFKGKIIDYGAIKNHSDELHSTSVCEFKRFVKSVTYMCGHNIINHDLKYLDEVYFENESIKENVIDTLYLSPLLFPAKPYHALLKDEKLINEEVNNPLSDAKKVKELFFDELSAFNKLDSELKEIFYLLLKNQIEFKSFFNAIKYSSNNEDLALLIKKYFAKLICENVDFDFLIKNDPISLAYCLSMISINDRHSIAPPWVLKHFPRVQSIVDILRNTPCKEPCSYCKKKFNSKLRLAEYFGFKDFKTFDGENLQEIAVNAALEEKSFLTIFPTGGGKSLTFQLPALIAGETVKGLTIVISPLQSLMKDQVEGLERYGITEVSTINGMLDPIERSMNIKKVEDGIASILYISPEALRSKTIEKLLLGRKIIRFVIDEAHCLSSWGHDFRVDYLFIADFIKNFKEKSNLEKPIPVSCFTATAKKETIHDISEYFKNKLSLDLLVFSTKETRKNLQHKVLEKESFLEKYVELRNLLLERECPTIIYVSRTKKAFDLAEKLNNDGFQAKPYHGKMKPDEKKENQNMFISGKIPIIVATTAFGMGVDKKNIGRIVHFDISDSIENYIQESGRAGRDESISADCYILFSENDLNKHFALLNQSKLNIKEIQEMWKAIKELTIFRNKVSQSALELARKAGWDDALSSIEVRVKSAISALEDSGFIKREMNSAYILTDCILCKTAMEAIDIINNSDSFDHGDKLISTRIIKSLIGSKSRFCEKEINGTKYVDLVSLSEILGLSKDILIKNINLMRDAKILSDEKDLLLSYRHENKPDNLVAIFNEYIMIEKTLLEILNTKTQEYNIKEINEMAEKKGCKKINPDKIFKILNYWSNKKLIKYRRCQDRKNYIKLNILEYEETFNEKIEKRILLGKFVIEYIFDHTINNINEEKKIYQIANISLVELKNAYNSSARLFKKNITLSDIEEMLYYLSRIDIFFIEGGFMVIHNPMSIERLENNLKRRYKIEDYEKFSLFYRNKVLQIHIVGEFAKKLLSDYKKALIFAEDYFHLDSDKFLQKYFDPQKIKEMKKNISPKKFNELFGALSPTQLSIINDQKSKYIAVLAGPGSGKTRILVHKLASLILMEDIKHEKLLMLTFSRAAATEFRKRLKDLIGNAANFVEIKTFHSYCFDLLGIVGKHEDFKDIVRNAINVINDGSVELCRISKSVLVIDEAQDLDQDSYDLINILKSKNEDMRIIAVGDDDQNIFDFRGSSPKFFEQFITENDAKTYDLLQNYRSKNNLIVFTNNFSLKIKKRLKTNPIMPITNDNGTICIVRHENNKNLLAPFVNDISKSLNGGKTCAITYTNDDALQVAGLLKSKGLSAQLIQSSEWFDLFDLAELRYFYNYINKDQKNPYVFKNIWKDAKISMNQVYKNSDLIDICNKIVTEFEDINLKLLYISDFKNYLTESRFEDFMPDAKEKILVSTIHKTKGKEFDNVFILINNFSIDTDEKRRQIYVAITRAKSHLTIHTDQQIFNNIMVDNMKKFINKKDFGPNLNMSIQLSHRDVWLGFFVERQDKIEKLQSGNELFFNNNAWENNKGDVVCKPSKRFIDTLERVQKNNYEIKRSKVNFVVYWKDKESDPEKEIKIVLPELELVKRKISAGE